MMTVDTIENQFNDLILQMAELEVNINKEYVGWVHNELI